MVAHERLFVATIIQASFVIPALADSEEFMRSSDCLRIR